MDLILSVLPIVLLIYLMVKRNALPSYVALPLIAGLVYIIHLTYFDGSFLELNANFISAIISVMTPITVIFGAVLAPLVGQYQPKSCSPTDDYRLGICLYD